MDLNLQDIKVGFLVKLNYKHYEMRCFSISIRNLPEEAFWKVIKKEYGSCVIKAPCGEPNYISNMEMIKEVKGYFSEAA